MSAYPELAIDDFCTTGSGGTPSRAEKQYYNGSIPWVKSGELRESVITDTEEKITERAIAESSAKIVPSEAILLAMYGATVGRMAVLGVYAATNQAICNIRPNEDRAFPRYVFHCLQSKISHFLSRAEGGAQPNISQAIIRETKIPLPPLDEQRRIAAILDKADALRRERKRTLKMLGSLKQAVFYQTFGDPSSNHRALEVVQIKDLLESTQYGKSDKAGLVGKYPILRMGNITSTGEVDTSDLKYIDLLECDIARYTLRPGDILFNRTNSPELVGKTAVFTQNKPMAFAGYIVRARTRKGVSPHYISDYLHSKHGKATLRGMAKSIVGMANINAKEMQTINILLPCAASQRTYSKAVEAIRQQQATVKAQAQTYDRLFTSLQHRAFSGKL